MLENWSPLQIVLLMVGLMSGILSVFREAMRIYRGEAIPQRSLFWHCILLAFILSMGILLWQKSNQITELQGQLDSLNKPQLSLTIDELGTGEMVEGNGSRNPGVFLIANLTNKGAPSIAEGWKLQITLLDGRSGEFLPTYMAPDQTISGSKNVVGNDWKMSMADALYAKANKPIQRGDKVRGILIFNTPSFKVEDMRKQGVKYTLRCTDVNGIKIQYDFTFTGTPVEHHYYPGLSPIPH